MSIDKDSVDIEIKYCAYCGENEVKFPKKKYCSKRCAMDAKNEQRRNKRRLEREQRKTDPSHERRQLSGTPPNALEIYEQKLMEGKFNRAIQMANAPQFLEQANRNQRLENKIDALEVLLGEILKAIKPPSGFNEEEAMIKAIALLGAYREIETPVKIRKRLQSILKISKGKAAMLLQKAERIINIIDPEIPDEIFEDEEE